MTYYAFPDIHWQKIRTNNPLERIVRDPPPNPRRRCFSGRSIMSQPCCRTAALHRRNSLVDQAIHEYAASLPAAGDANRSRRLIKCAKFWTLPIPVASPTRRRLIPSACVRRSASRIFLIDTLSAGIGHPLVPGSPVAEFDCRRERRLRRHHPLSAFTGMLSAFTGNAVRVAPDSAFRQGQV